MYCRIYRYRKTSNTSRTKSQNLNDSHLVFSVALTLPIAVLKYTFDGIRIHAFINWWLFWNIFTLKRYQGFLVCGPMTHRCQSSEIEAISQWLANELGISFNNFALDWTAQHWFFCSINRLNQECHITNLYIVVKSSGFTTCTENVKPAVGLKVLRKHTSI